MSDFDRVPVPNPEFGAREVESETVFLSPAGDEIHSLDEVGTFIWRHIDGRRDLADLLRLLLAEYDVGEAQARDDLARFVDELAGRGIVTLGDRAG